MTPAHSLGGSKMKKIRGIEKWEVENDLRSLREAEEIKNDKKRLKAVKHLADMELKSLANVAADKKKLG